MLFAIYLTFSIAFVVQQMDENKKGSNRSTPSTRTW